MEISDLTNLNYYHRDLSWLLFNRRVIHEAKDASNSLLEQLRFLAIASSNLDEFFMVRVPSIQSVARLKPDSKDRRTGWTKKEVLLKLYEMNLNNTRLQYQYYDALIEKLEEQLYFIQDVEELQSEDRQEVADFFHELLLPAITHIGLDVYHAFPKIVEKSIHLFVKLRQGEDVRQAIVPLPPLFKRLHQLSNPQTYVYLEQIIAYHLSDIFVGWEIEHSFFFRITYDKDLEFQEDADEELFLQMEEYVIERNKGLASRLEISGEWSATIEESVLYLAEKLQLESYDLYWVPGPLDLTFLFPVVDELAEKLPELIFPNYKGNPHKELQGEALFRKIEQEDLLLQHPYDSFEVVLRLLEAAAEDPNTIAIKQTLYRMAPNSRVIAALKKAAMKGKQVTVLVELKARFDEENNLHWVQELEQAGCYVSYGLQHLKTHCKALLIVKKEKNQIKQYAHFGTGNYNEKSAKLYTDISFFTAKNEYVEDITVFFNFLSGYRSVPEYQQISVSPNGIREMLLENIQAVMDHFQETKTGEICFKINSLTDTVIIDKLYEASQIGIPIYLIVRGACCLKPGVANLSETIQVTSIVGRFLEHSRIYAFSFGDEKESKVWISSADAMTRNMLHRIEIATPVTGSTRDELETILETFKKDQKKAYYLEENGLYKRHLEGNDFSAQDFFMENSVSLTVVSKESSKEGFLAKIRQLWQHH
ncbi:polyphosphate kinase 1 [Enterococcus olivae]